MTSIIAHVLLMLLPVTNTIESLDFALLHGRWKLMYRGNYGYEMRFYKNYHALCIIYMQSSALVFKGIYTIERNQTIRININQMKNVNSCCNINTTSGFINVRSSYFIFHARIITKDNKKMLELKPQSIVIDGINSDGYFEPIILLQRM